MRIKKNILLFLIIGILAGLVSMCSKLKKDSPTQPSETEAALHQTGWLDTLSTNFHGKYIREQNWNLAECSKCHGADYQGGTSELSCNINTCHPESPEACITCHGGVNNATGAPPKDIENNKENKFKGVGAHTAHVNESALSEREIDCTDCHVKPATITAKGHLDTDLPAEIVWGEFAATGNLNPQYSDLTCQNTYCHGASLSGGTQTAPVWTQNESLDCRSCHGQPPTSGAHKKHISGNEGDCLTCHDGYSKNEAVNIKVHIDGNRDVQLSEKVGGTYGKANGVCSNVSCHGSGDSPAWTEDVALACTGCHGGSDNQTGAPPKDLNGNTAVTFTGVGAHTRHVSNPQWGVVIDCNECHKKPVNVNDPGHVDNNLPAEINWGELAKRGDLSPEWNGTSCQDVYCHGTTLADGSNTEPVWTRSDDLTCDACHGLPPSTGAHDTHIDNLNLDCRSCHQGYEKNVAVNEQEHVNGSIDVELDEQIGGNYANGVCSNVLCHGSGDSPEWAQQVAFGCVDCHGGMDNNSGAPPVDLRGNSTPSYRGVGAHTAHVGESRWGRSYDCIECHTKPTSVAAAGHIDLEQYAEINWGTFAKTGGLTPSWDEANCADVYCHGGSLEGGSDSQPLWTSSADLSCDACHGLPPNSGAHSEHTENYQIDCDVCHDDYSKDNTVNSDLHLDGKYDVRLSETVGGTYINGVCSNVACHGAGETPKWNEDIALLCTSCHGGVDNSTGAPPTDLQGQIATTETGVGAHTMHVSDTQWAQPVDCGECHTKPALISDTGHIDLTPPAEIIWGPLSQIDGLSAQWNGSTCENVYCHGASLTGGTISSSTWTEAQNVTCQSCHDLPPASGAHSVHVDNYNLDCNICHEGYVKDSEVNLPIHINGNRDVQLSSLVGGSYSNGVCSSVICHGGGDSPDWNVQTALGCSGCHGGTDNDTGAPPVDLEGNLATTFKGVGAHSIHITGGELSDGMDCDECHVKPLATGDAGHIGSELLPAEITWGRLATEDDASPEWDGVQYCSNVYCHGEWKYGIIDNITSWIIVDGTQAQCGSCHTLPPENGHPPYADCSLCHGSVVNENNTIIDKEKHINGQPDY